MGEPRKLVAVFNSSDEVLQIIEEALEMHGYATITGHIDDIRRGRLDLLEILENYDPAVVVWDIAPPYLENWRFLTLIRHVDLMQGRKIVVTSTNVRALGEHVNVEGIIEMLGRPFGMEELLDRVEKLTGQEQKVLGHTQANERPK